MSDSIIVLESYYEPMAAHLARTRLEAAGIPCFLSNEHLISLNRLYSPVAGGVRLHVYERDAAAAQAVLREETAPPMMVSPTGQLGTAAAPGGPPAAAAVHCPRCGSDNVAYGPATEGPATNWFYLLLSVLLRYPLRGRVHHCFHCGKEWR